MREDSAELQKGRAPLFKRADLKDNTKEELTVLFAEFGERNYRVAQCYSWLFEHGVTSIDEMTNLSKELRERLKERFYVDSPEVADLQSSIDGTRKLLIRLTDGEIIECVLIPEGDRMTLCLSTQVGCKLDCRFCMTALGGFTRNLTLSEMASEVHLARGVLEGGESITNIVFMGMGEPLDNYDNLMRFIKVLTDQKGFSIGQRHVTVSTSGLVPQIERFFHDTGVNLAVSLNATTDEQRLEIMPVNKAYPISKLMKTLRTIPLGTKKRITIEYVLIGGFNDSDDDARRLSRLLKGLPCKVNLIPLNPYPGSNYNAPERARVDAFWKIMRDAGYVVVTRKSKGSDILAACGQLRGRRRAVAGQFP